MLANDLSLSIRNPTLIYSFLALYGLITILLFTYVQAKFRIAAKTLKLLQTEWQSAESTHTSFVGIAQEHLSKLSGPPSPVPTYQARAGGIGLEIRQQIAGMAKRGKTATDIARTCGLQEGEVEVILGMARLQR